MIVRLILLELFLRAATGDIFTSMEEIQNLKKVETHLSAVFRKYVTQLEEKVIFLKREMGIYESQILQLEADPSKCTTNPINKFIVLKRLTKDRKQVQKIVKASYLRDLLSDLEIVREKYELPTEDDLRGAALAIRRVQRTYNLETYDLANGIFNGIKSGSSLSADDCYDVGNLLFDQQEYEYSARWMKQAVEQQHIKSEAENAREMIRKIVLSYGVKENTTEIEETPNKTNSPDSKSFKILDSMKVIDKNGTEDEVEEIEEEQEQVEEVIKKDEDPLEYNPLDTKSYEKLCRGDVAMTPKELAPMRCRYVDNQSKFLKIAPIRMEEVSLDPYIAIYHDVIYQSEIEILKALAIPKFGRSLLFDPNLGEYRVSKTSWVDDKNNTILTKLSQRIEDMTGLSLKTAEDFQVLNYGIGGHYQFHYDYMEDRDTDQAFEIGNRIATVLFYLSNVTDGGSTVFPFLNARILPEKGSAVLWYNLFRSGRGDYRTTHAGCPVLVGTKWVANKWLHSHGQELLRPCLLQPDHPPDYMIV